MNSVKLGLRNIPAVYVTLLLVVVVNMMMNHRILSENGINNLAIQMVPTLIAVMAQTCVLLARELDLSVGSNVGLSTVLMSATMEKWGLFSIVIVLVISILIGMLNGALAVYFKVPGIVITLATSMIVTGGALLILPTPGGYVSLDYARFVLGHHLFVPNTLFILAAVLLCWKYLRMHPWGHSLLATGGNEYSAYASGLKVQRSKILAFTLSSVLAAIAGMVLAAKTMSGDANIGTSYTLTSIAGAVLGGVSFLGGVGSMRKAIAGAVVIVLLVNILFFIGISSFYQYIFQGVILLVSVVVTLRNQNNRH
ncbi:ABC transporter permease [Cohnella faecalis]|nr:ABC transporter permease [Cohnella faecalis]